MTHEAHINGVLVYLKSFENNGEIVYVNILTGAIEHPAHVNPMRLSQKNMYRNEIDKCILPMFETENDNTNTENL